MSYPPPNQPDHAPGDAREASYTPAVAQVPNEIELDQIRSVITTQQ